MYIICSTFPSLLHLQSPYNNRRTRRRSRSRLSRHLFKMNAI